MNTDALSDDEEYNKVDLEFPNFVLITVHECLCRLEAMHSLTR